MGKLRIRVKPNARKNKVEKMSDGIFKIWVNNPSIKGKANKELISYLRCITGKAVNIICGLTSRNKIIEFEGSEEGFIKKLDKRYK